MANQIRGLLAEQGVAIARDISRLRVALGKIVDGDRAGLGDLILELVRNAREELAELDQRISSYNQRLKSLIRTDEMCRRIGKIKGIGPVTATALVAAVGDRNALRTAASSPLGSGWSHDRGLVAVKYGRWGSPNVATDTFGR